MQRHKFREVSVLDRPNNVYNRPNTSYGVLNRSNSKNDSDISIRYEVPTIYELKSQIEPNHTSHAVKCCKTSVRTETTCYF